MMESDEPTLQTVLIEKYGIYETLVVEGRFVFLVEDQAAKLVCLGLGAECLVMANIVFTGASMDYDLKSLVPLSVLSISHQCASQTLEVRSENRHTQMFQLCSCANKIEIWEMFTSTINKLYQPETEDGCVSESLKLVSSPNSTVQLVSSELELRQPKVAPEERLLSSDYCILRTYPNITEVDVKPNFTSGERHWSSDICILRTYPNITEVDVKPNFTSGERHWSSDSCILRKYLKVPEFEFKQKFRSGKRRWSSESCILQKFLSSTEFELQPKFTSGELLCSIQRQYPKTAESSVSLPAKLPTQVTARFPDTSVEFHSADCLDIEFDNFVNDVPGSIVDVNDSNVSNIDSLSSPNIVLNLENYGQKSDNRFIKFFRRFFLCCVGRK